MNKSISQDNLNDNQISKSIRRFFTRFHLSSALKAANAYKKKGVCYNCSRSKSHAVLLFGLHL